ncbi:hypothetical protein CMASS_08210 [Corynebacterium massiliense DSM 45435]|uniref:Secreted protein n=1 Tax=Corynebacterium massiliense DSM 45435 TaxID=1121364 RepID=A0ABY7U8P7_9CORY|nr:hypothetical protein CMASS_08210 [Corynebacterium massiliense DSM 45435]
MLRFAPLRTRSSFSGALLRLLFGFAPRTLSACFFDAFDHLVQALKVRRRGHILRSLHLVDRLDSRFHIGQISIGNTACQVIDKRRVTVTHFFFFLPIQFIDQGANFIHIRVT